MEKIPYYFIFFAFALTFFINTSPICSATLTPLNSTTDQEALIALKNSITLDPSGILANNWSTIINSTSSINICSWIGISCSTKHQRVTTLNISGFQISGELPLQLVNLTFLKVFDVSSNGFTGEIPSWIGSLLRLEILDLNNNSFGGTVPKSLFDGVSSSRLKILDLSYNLLGGTIPKEIGNSNSSSLEDLCLMFNHFHGRIPSGIGNLKMLKMLLLGVNDFEGDVYSYGVTLMEMFTGKRPTNEMFGGEMGLKEWVSEALQENKVSEIVANGLLEREDENYYAKEECISYVFHLAMKCLAFSPHERIDMVEIVSALHKIKAKIHNL